MNRTQHQTHQVKEQREERRGEGHFKFCPAAQSFWNAEQKQKQNLGKKQNRELTRKESALAKACSENSHKNHSGVIHVTLL